MALESGKMIRKASVGTVCVTTIAALLGAIAARPIIDPSCLGHHATEAAEAHTGHATTSSAAAGTGSDDHASSSALMQACLCWFAGIATPSQSFEGARYVAPRYAPTPAPGTVALQPIPFALPYANGPPALS